MEQIVIDNWSNVIEAGTVITFKNQVSTKSDSDYERYKASCNQVAKELCKARKVFEEKLAQDVKDNPKSFYRYVHSRMKSKDKVGPLKDSVGNVIDDDKGMCDMLNDFSVVKTDPKN